MAWNIKPSSEEIAFLMEAGFVLKDAKRFEQAEEVFKGVRALVPQNEVPEAALGAVCLDQGKLEEAIKHYKKALELNPKSAYAHAQLAEAYLFKHDKAAAKQEWKVALELDPKGDIGKLARAYIEAAETVVFK